jgi:YD repeat-containing protein
MRFPALVLIAHGQCTASAGSPYATTSYAYDVLGNLATVTDALGNQSTMTYDTLSRKTAMHDPDMGNWSYISDAVGNLIQQTDAKAQNLYFQYDELNRRRQKDFGTQKALGSGDVVYTYDGSAANNLVGRLAQVADSTGTVTFQYDVLGQISSSTRTLFTTPYTFSYTRDTMSRLSTVTYPDNSVITYTYNGPFADQVKEGSTVYAQYNNYNALGQPVSTSYSNGVTTYFTYERTPSGSGACRPRRAAPRSRIWSMSTTMWAMSRASRIFSQQPTPNPLPTMTSTACSPAAVPMARSPIPTTQSATC